MKPHFAALSQIFPQNHFLYTIFEVNGQILSFPPHSECSFHGNQNDRQNLMVSTQKLIVKRPILSRIFWLKYVIVWRFGLAHKVQRIFCIYLGSGCIVYKTDLSLKLWACAGHFEYHESYILSGGKITTYGHLPQKLSKKKQFCRKIWANGTIREFIWITVKPKEVESVEISHSPQSLLQSVIKVGYS